MQKIKDAGIYTLWIVMGYSLLFIPGKMLAGQLAEFYPEVWFTKLLNFFF